MLDEAIQRFLHGCEVLGFQALKGKDLLGRVVRTIERICYKESPLVRTDIFNKAVKDEGVLIESVLNFCEVVIVGHEGPIRMRDRYNVLVWIKYVEIEAKEPS